MSMNIDKSKLSPALTQAAKQRIKELGCDSLAEYFDTLERDGDLNRTDPAMHAFLSQFGKSFNQDQFRHIRQRVHKSSGAHQNLPN